MVPYAFGLYILKALEKKGDKSDDENEKEGKKDDDAEEVEGDEDDEELEEVKGLLDITMNSN